MKKFLTVLLVIAVMFTFSFGSAFAAVDATKVVSTSSAALAKITDKYDAAVDTLDAALIAAKAARDTAFTVAAWNEACQDAYDAALAQLDIQLAEAYQAYGDAEQFALSAGLGEILGYEFASPQPATADGYAYIAAAIAKIDVAAINTTTWNGTAFEPMSLAFAAQYDVVLADTLNLIKNYDLTKFATDDKVTVGTETKTSYEWAADAQADALAYLGAFGDYNTTVKINNADVVCKTDNVWAVYKVLNAGTEGESYSGSFYDAIKNLKTVAVATTDAAKIEYAKAQYIAKAEAAMTAARNAELKVQNDIIFAQSVASKPSQTAITAAQEEIEKINKKYDALEEVWGYRLANAEYKINAGVVTATYNDATIATIGSFDANNVFTVGNFTVTAAVIDAAVATAEAVDALEKEAETLKATIYVDGAAALDVDAALEKAIEKTYMTGTKATLAVANSDTVVHFNAHKLLGTACALKGVDAETKVTLDSKKYDTLANWATTGYSPENTKAVKAIIDAAEDAIKEAATVADANAAFLAAYAEYDAVLTTAEQAALFNYNGALYKQDTAAFAELNAYINYKVALMEDAPATGTAAALQSYYAANLLTEVNNADDLAAAVAEAKATVDSLKTKAELKAQATELSKAATAVKRAVVIEQKAEVLALYDEIVDYEKYCQMVGYTVAGSVTSAKNLIKTDIERLEDLEKAALDAAKKELGTVAKLTLEDAAAVAAYADAQEAYNDLYAPTGDYAAALANPVEYTDADAYEAKIFALSVAAAEAKIKALPVNATLAQVLEAKDAVEALGFEGLCAVSETWLTKLDKFEQDANEAIASNVEALKITAGSSAKKGSITVKWSVKGDTTGVEGYEIWKSTKKNSGYKKAFTTTKKSYKNTKGLKKGTRYYYKVRAFAYVEGEKLTSDWSNKAYRIAK